MNGFKSILVGVLFLLVAACEQPLLTRSLPFPTPAQHELIVLAVPGALTYVAEENGTASGLEHDLIEAFALELGVAVKFRLAPPEEIDARMAAGEAHIAIGWLGEPANPEQVATPPILQSHDVLMQHEASLPLTRVEELRGRTVHAQAGSRQLASLRELQKRVPDLHIVESSETEVFDLLETIASQKVDFVAIDSTLVDLAIQLVPALQASLPLSKDAPVVWWLGKKPNAELLARVVQFAEKAQRNGTLAGIEDRYFGHVHRLKQLDIVNFLGEIESTLPKFRKYFQAAELVTGLDWRLLAAVAYHESKWDPNATSYTNVRGIMMLTEETADRLRVNNRLDPKEAVLAGARYINSLREQVGVEAREPDRTWLALAAYNIGPGSFGVGQRLAKMLQADSNNWYEMKRVLPLLAKPKYQQQLRSGRIRGGEAVILVENIRSYYNILLRNAPAFNPTPANAAGIRRLVAEVEQLQRSYVRKVAVATPDRSSISAENEDAPPRLPMIEASGEALAAKPE